MDIKTYNQIIQQIRDIIKDTPYEGHVYAVGGCVRDLVRNETVKDVDLVVDLKNGGIGFTQWLEDKGYVYGDTIISSRFGTASFRLKPFIDEWFDCVQTRSEKYVDRNSRNPSVTFGTMDEDAHRRDFTVNALYHNISTGAIIDTSGRGVQDIEDGLITTVDNPDVIFNDDPLRMMRAIRFASRYGWRIDEKTVEGIKNNASRLQIISIERINNELTQILCSKGVVSALDMLVETGLMQYIIPEFMTLVGLEQNRYHFGDVYQHTCAVVGESAGGDIVDMLAALLHDIGKSKTMTVDQKGVRHFIGHEFVSAKMCKEILQRLKYPNVVIKEVETLVKWHMFFKPFGNDPHKLKRKHVRQMQYEMGNPMMFEKLKRLIHSDNLSHATEYCLGQQLSNIEMIEQELVIDGESGYNYRSPVTGREMLTLLNTQPGKLVGHAVKRTTEWALKCDRLPDHQKCVQYIKQNVKNWKQKYSK